MRHDGLSILKACSYSFLPKMCLQKSRYLEFRLPVPNVWCCKLLFLCSLDSKHNKQRKWQDPPPPPWFEVLVIFDFLHYRIEEVERHLLWKFHKKNQRKSWSNVPPKLLACIRFHTKLYTKSAVSESSIALGRLNLAGPPWFEFLVIFDFFAPWYRRSKEASSVKIS